MERSPPATAAETPERERVRESERTDRSEDGAPPATMTSSAASLLRMQQRAGNGAVTGLLQRRGDGAPLPRNAAAAHRALGATASAVRVRRGHVDRPGALAKTDGLDITLAPGAPAPETPEGGVLLAHEAVHVLQQAQGGGQVMGERDAEAQADDVMLAALSGRSIPRVRAASGPHYFEARWHQATLTNAMDESGFSDAEQQEAYFANWCRDVSQAMVPPATRLVGHQNVMLILNVMSELKFGRGVTPQELGRYSRREHIDAPAGQTNLDQLGGVGELGALATDEERELWGRDQHIRGRGDLPVEGGPGEGPTEIEDLSSRAIGDLMQIDESGVPAYVRRSRDYIHEQATSALVAGRTAEGLQHLGNFSHTVQDLFAHSNWVEIAIGKLIQSGAVTLDLSASGPEGEAAREIQEREGEGRPPIETYAGEVQNAAGNVRPILTTGTFSGSFGDPGHDTAISLRHEAGNVLREHNPFIPGQADDKWWDLGIDLLERAEVSAEEGTLGPIFTGHIEDILIVTDIADAVTGAAHGLAEGAEGIPLLGDLAQEGAELVEGGVRWAGDAWKGGVRQASEVVVNTVLSNVSVADMARFVKDGTGAIASAWDSLKDFVSDLPDHIKNAILPKLVAAERQFKEEVRELGQDLWANAVDSFMSALGEGEPMLQERESNIERKLQRMLDQIDGLRTELFATLDRVAPTRAGEIKAQLAEMPLGDVLPYLASGQFADLLGQLEAGESERLRAAAREYGETSERIAQLHNLPDWARPGPSHSQLAKDHASSPFFGAAFTLANVADRTLVGALRDAWDALGSTGPAPGLEGDEGELVDVPADNPTEPSTRQAEEREGESGIERDRRTKFLETREEGERVLERGHGEVHLPTRSLGEAADALAALLDEHPGLGPLLDQLISLLRQTAPGAQIIAECERVREYLDSPEAEAQANEAFGIAEDAVTTVYGTIRGTIALVIRAVGGSEGDEDHHDEEHGEHTPAFYEEQIESLDQFRGPGDRVQVEGEAVDADITNARRRQREETAADERLRRSRERGDVEAVLFDEIDRIFAHPYDSSWWVAPAEGWANAHKAVLAQYILARNGGQLESHAH